MTCGLSRNCIYVIFSTTCGLSRNCIYVIVSMTIYELYIRYIFYDVWPIYLGIVYTLYSL